jgi:putative transcriptional regulator
MANHSLAPGLLLAAPRLGDPNFQRTVVLLGRHESGGALGWVINGRALRSVREILTDANLVPDGVSLPKTPSFEAIARIGGPVQTNSGWLAFRRDVARPIAGEIDIGPDLAVTGDAGVLGEVIRGGDPAFFRLFLGYAGWGPGQLEAEVKEGAWLPAPVDAGLLFDIEAEDLWDAAYKRTVGIAPAAFTSTKRGLA